MGRESLLAFYRDYIAEPSRASQPFIVHDNGYRARTWTYGDIAAASEAFAARLDAAGCGAGDKVVLWSENRGEWIAALWGCLLRGIVAVPVDFRSSAEHAHRIAGIVDARVVVIGDEVKPGETARPLWRMAELAEFRSSQVRGCASSGSEPEPANPRTGEPANLAEIIFTSGATSEPKGVTLTHRNILANIHPVEREFQHYRKYLRLVSPIRFLNLLPLSHMFGQSCATFMPPLIPPRGGTVVFSHGYNPQEIVRQIKSRRVSVLVCVPKVLDVLKEHVERTFRPAPAPGAHWLRRWWIHREVRRAFGWKFWAFVVGGARLEPELENYWRELGYLVVQGYGLTETAPIVTLNHPLKKAAAGTVGTALTGVEIRIADDGEILVRGENVTAGYYGSAASPFKDGWFHTGDIGELDTEGRLTIRGRKKEMIVRADGLNVFPEDVERAINAQPGVKDSAVVGVRQGGQERVHAVLVLEPGASADAIVRGANARLEEHQRVSGASVWTAGDLPRTEGTGKLRRKEIQRWAEGGSAATERRDVPAESVEEIVSAFAGRPVSRETTFEELGLGSLDRIQILARVEEAFATSIDEGEFAAATTVGALSDLVTGRSQGSQGSQGSRGSRGSQVQVRSEAVPRITFPAWNRSVWARAIRRVSLPTWVLSISRPWMALTVEGLENLEGLDHPVIFAPNHQSHMDTPAILQALPNRWRYRVATAMAKEWFKAHFFPEQHSRAAYVRNTAAYVGATLFYNAFPIPQYEAGARQTIRYIGRLFEAKHSLLIFPEGKRTDYGEINVFRPGIGMIASRLGVPVVPVRIEGLDKVLHLSKSWPARGPVRITFGKPMRLEGRDYRALAAQVREAVIGLQPYKEPPIPRGVA